MSGMSKDDIENIFNQDLFSISEKQLLYSIAVSLKRIADIMEPKPFKVEVMTKEEHAAYLKDLADLDKRK